METIGENAISDALDVHLDALWNCRLSGEKDMDSLTQDWNFLEDIDHEKYLPSPLSGDMLPVDCSAMDILPDPELLGNFGDVAMGTDLSTSTDDIRSPSCKSCASDTDSQYDSGIGESISGEESECSVLSGSSQSNGSPMLLSEPDPSKRSTDSTKDKKRSSKKSGASKKEDPVVKNKTETCQSTKAKRESSRYNLRTSSVINRVETEQKTQEPRQPKPKMRPPPLSKYRRKTANARERSRMTEINEAFAELQEVLPNMPEGKQTKITTLKLAMQYITALREMLADEGVAQCSDGSLEQAQPISDQVVL